MNIEKKTGSSSIKVNFIFNAILTLSSFIFPIITFPYITRVLGPSGTGSYNFASSVINYFSMFAMLGIPTYGIRACAQVRDDKLKLSKTASEIFTINLITTVLSYLVFFVAIFNVAKFQEYKELLCIISISIIFNTIGMEWLFKSLELYSYITIRSLLFKILSVFLMFILVKTEKDIIIYSAIFVFSTSGAYLLNFFKAQKYIDLHFYNLDLKKHLKPIIVFFAMSVAVTIYTNLDNVMLGFMTSDADVGYYSAAVKIKYILASIVSSLGAVLLPRASNCIENHQIEEFNRISGKAINFVCVLAVPVSIYFMLFAKQGILFIAGNEYESAIVPMQVIMPTVLLIGLTNIMGIQMLVPLGKEKAVLFSEISGAGVDLALNMLLIPSYRATGAAIGTLMAEATVFIVQFFALKKEVVWCFKRIQFPQIIVSTICACIISYLFYESISLNVFFTLCFTAIIFFGVYGIFLILLREELTISVVNEIKHKVKSKQ